MKVTLTNLGCIGIPMSSVKDGWKVADRVKHVHDKFYVYLYEGKPQHPAYMTKQFVDTDYVESGEYDLPLDDSWRIPL